MEKLCVVCVCVAVIAREEAVSLKMWGGNLGGTGQRKRMGENNATIF